MLYPPLRTVVSLGALLCGSKTLGSPLVGGGRNVSIIAVYQTSIVSTYELPATQESSSSWSSIAIIVGPGRGFSTSSVAATPAVNTGGRGFSVASTSTTASSIYEITSDSSSPDSTISSSSTAIVVEPGRGFGTSSIESTTSSSSSSPSTTAAPGRGFSSTTSVASQDSTSTAGDAASSLSSTAIIVLLPTSVQSSSTLSPLAINGGSQVAATTATADPDSTTSISSTISPLGINGGGGLSSVISAAATSSTDSNSDSSAGTTSNDSLSISTLGVYGNSKTTSLTSSTNVATPENGRGFSYSTASPTSSTLSSSAVSSSSQSGVTATDKTVSTLLSDVASTVTTFSNAPITGSATVTNPPDEQSLVCYTFTDSISCTFEDVTWGDTAPTSTDFIPTSTSVDAGSATTTAPQSPLCTAYLKGDTCAWNTVAAVDCVDSTDEECADIAQTPSCTAFMTDSGCACSCDDTPVTTCSTVLRDGTCGDATASATCSTVLRDGTCGDATASATCSTVLRDGTCGDAPLTTSSILYTNTSTIVPTATSYYGNGTTATDTLTACITLASDDPGIVWSFLPNTTTVTITITVNSSSPYGNSTSYSSTISAWSPPPTCSTSIISFAATSTQSSALSATPQSLSSTVVVTSKTGPTSYTTVTTPRYGGGKPDKKSTITSDSPAWGPISTTSTSNVAASVVETTAVALPAQTPSSPADPVTTSIGGVTIVVNPSQVVVGSQTVQNTGSTTVLTVAGQTITVNPSQVIGSGVTIAVPTSTTVAGVTVVVGASQVIIGTQTVNVPSSGSATTVTANGQTFTVTPSQVVGPNIAISIPTNSPASGGTVPTNIVILDGSVVYVYGTTKAVIGDETYTYSAGSAPETEVFNGETITVGPDGVMFGQSTINGNADPTGLQIGIVGGITVTEVGSSIAIIEGNTFTIGSNQAETTTVIDGQTITAGPSGLVVGGATLTFPFNIPTQVITAGGITFSEIGASLIDIGGTTFTVGPGAKPTTDIVNGQTISIGPSGVVFKTTTVLITSMVTPSGSATGTSTAGKKSEASGLLAGPALGVLVWGICIALGVGLF